MKTFKSIFALALAITFILTGCAREAYTPPVLPTNTKGTCTPSPTDQDGDCITDPNEYTNNETTKEISCKLDNGAVVYLDCVTAPDCNCNLIPDGEEVEITEKCGWGCVAGNARTWTMISGALILGYAGYAAIAGTWPFTRDKSPANDDLGNEIEYISLVDSDDRINFDESYVRFLKDEAAVKVYIDGKCKSDKDPSQFYCKLEYQYGIDHIVIPPRNSTATNPFTDNLDYSYDLKKSKVHGQSLHYLKVTDTRKDEEYFLKDPKWLGLPIKDKDGSMSVGFKLSEKVNCPGDSCIFNKLETGFEESKGCYQLHQGSSYLSQNQALFSDTNPIFYFWKRYACPKT